MGCFHKTKERIIITIRNSPSVLKYHFFLERQGQRAHMYTCIFFFSSYRYGRNVKPLQSCDIFKKIPLMINVLLSFKVDFLPMLVFCF